MMRAWLLAGAACGCAAIGAMALAENAASGITPPAPIPHGPVASVRVQPAKETTLAAQVTGYGTIAADPNQVLTVAAPYAAVVMRLLVRAGEAVQDGQALAELRPSPAQALAWRDAAAQVQYAKAELARTQQMLREKLATHAQVAQAEKALNDAAAKLQTLREEGADRASSTIAAPAAGMVVATQAESGQVLAQGAPLMTIAPRDAIAVQLGIEPEDVASVRPGMEVSLRDAFDPAVHLSGTVVSVGAALSPRTRLVDVLVRLASRDAADPPLVGRFVVGQITVRRAHVVAVPREAVLQDSQGDYVFVVRDGVARRVAVTPGIETETLVAVGNAVAPGEEVVTQGNYELQNGMAVRQVRP